MLAFDFVVWCIYVLGIVVWCPSLHVVEISKGCAVGGKVGAPVGEVGQRVGEGVAAGSY